MRGRVILSASTQIGACAAPLRPACPGRLSLAVSIAEAVTSGGLLLSAAEVKEWH
jgi:hypothetical protein